MGLGWTVRVQQRSIVCLHLVMTCKTSSMKLLQYGVAKTK